MINVTIAPDLTGALNQLKADLIADADAKAAASSAALNNQTATIQTELDAITTVNGQISSEVQAINSHTTTKTDAVLNAVNAKGVIKSIQRGVASGASTTMRTVIISPVDVSKAVIHFEAAGPVDVWARLKDSTTVEYAASGGSSGSVGWQVIEYE